ncbi:hypothetical protein AA310_02510 [Arthrobacter sp. YC-RL1]|nr:hypothetical protein ATC04_16320 [Arthrobacter sp. YC-RL1]KLI90412.1 hypothetical protein AA310_02510 [Arthrobacter sp. YC-RL1]
MRIRILGLAVAAAFLLSGCSSTPPQQPEVAPPAVGSTASSPAAEAVAPSSTQSAEQSVEPLRNSGQDWADEKIQMWVDNSGIKSTKGFLYPYNLMTGWTSPKPGVIDIKLANDMVFNKDGMQESYQGPTDELRFMGLIMFESIGKDSPELETITFSTENNKYSGTYTRALTGADPEDREAWAQEKYVQWLNSMNDTYESFCKAEITSLKIYRQCIPSDPHAYIDKVESPAPGELVVTLEDGPWMDGTYDLPASGFVSSNMMIRINEKNDGLQPLEKLTVTARGGEDTSVEEYDESING